MTTYRDSFEKCPRCAVELQDAGSARGCPACGGLLVEESVLTEMIQRMLPPGPLIRVQLEILTHAEPPIGCPSCGTTMEQTTLLQIPIERCPKHGVWFDRDELGRALYLTSTADRPPVVEVAATRSPPPTRSASGTIGARPATSPATDDPPSVNQPRDGSTTRTLEVTVRDPHGRTYTFPLARGIVKIGRLASAHLRLPDASVSRLHALLEVAPAATTIIDLGSSEGTLVNGERIDKQALRPDDEIRIGPYTVVVADAARETAEMLFDRYLAAVLAGRTSDPLVARVDERLGEPDFHAHVRLFVQALRMEGKAFTLESHAGLRDVLRELAG